MTEKELKQCPFCGSEPEYTEHNYIMCSNYDCPLNNGICKAFESAAVWNFRWPPKEQDDETMKTVLKQTKTDYFYGSGELSDEQIADFFWNAACKYCKGVSDGDKRP